MLTQENVTKNKVGNFWICTKKSWMLEFVMTFSALYHDSMITQLWTHCHFLSFCSPAVPRTGPEKDKPKMLELFLREKNGQSLKLWQRNSILYDLEKK